MVLDQGVLVREWHTTLSCDAGWVVLRNSAGVIEEKKKSPIMTKPY